MTGFELYSLVLCIVVLISLSAIFVAFLRISVGYYLKLVRGGEEDEALLKEEQNRKKGPSFWDGVNTVASAIVCVALVAAFLFSMAVQFTEDKHPLGIPTLTVVKSSSMSYKDEKNKYLFENDLNNQFDTFDLLLVHAMPDEFDLQLYDVVVYEAKDGTMIIHRIVGIEEPNAEHPDCRHFKFQGDAVTSSDRYPVLYSQMRGIYRGNRLPFAGSFILFMQSPAGWICILLVLFAVLATPIVERRINREKQARLAILHVLGSQHDDLVNVSLEQWKQIHQNLQDTWNRKPDKRRRRK